MRDPRFDGDTSLHAREELEIARGLCRRLASGRSDVGAALVERVRCADALSTAARQALFEGFIVALAKPPRKAISTREAELLWDWFSARLEGRGVARKSVCSEARGVDVAGEAARWLLLLPDPAAVWQASYDRLAPPSRRSAAGGGVDAIAWDHALLLLRVGLLACATHAASSRERTHRAYGRAFFWQLFDAARRLMRGSSPPVEVDDHVVVSCFACMKGVFEERLDEALERALGALTGSATLLSLAALGLWKGGVGAAQLDASMRELDVDAARALRSARDEFTAQGKEFPPRLRALERALREARRAGRGYE